MSDLESQALEIPTNLYLLQKESTQQDRQEILNKMFPLDRREEIVAQASQDIKGRHVRYYREMRWEHFVPWMERGTLSSIDYFNAGNGREFKNSTEFVDPEYLYLLLSEYGESVLHIPHETRMNQIEELFENQDKLPEVFQQYFTGASEEEVAALTRELTYKNILPFVEKHFPLDLQKRIHTGAMLQQFSSMLSLSVGGNRFPDIHSQMVVVEMIIPDEEVISHPVAREGEKEILTKTLSVDYISRVFVKESQLEEEVYKNPNIPVGQYALGHQDKKTAQAVYDWRIEESTKDCVPVGLRPTYLKT